WALLRARPPGLAAESHKLRPALDVAPPPRGAVTEPFGDGSASGAPPDRGPGPSAAPDRQRLARAFAAVQDRIRCLGGDFERFGLPPAETELRETAAQGPVVIVNVSPYGSHALLLTADGVRGLPLPALTPGAVTDRATSFHRALSDIDDPDHPDPMAAQEVLHRTLEWLWDVVAGPVLDALGVTPGPGRTPPPAGEPPRVWWVPGGALSRLPLHAAGHHRTRAADAAPRTVLDLVVSSLTPTVRALHHARRRVDAPPAPAARALVVAVPGQPGSAGHLSTANAEAALVARYAPGARLLTDGDVTGGEVSDGDATGGDATGGEVSGADGSPVPPADRPTGANVLRDLREATVAHFACHGLTDPLDPSRSRLVLQEDATGASPSDGFTVAALSAVDLPHARLAYLSACRTAAAEIAELQDESIHLTSAFLIAGFPQVIGTLWQVQDDAAYDMADTFYRELRARTPRGLAPAESARALRAAAVAARELLRAPSLWAAHLHTGA
ncbi:CHAT domain-containing protein, partial [Streptomyces sp. NPDC059894]|uniref:CHAT domain-containing protein n=1 Tax=Streptomyces sp. NPDC059894 TaxID=3346991 RepID=UPI0036523569